MPEQPTIAIPLDLPDVRVLRTELTKERELIIEVESTLTTALCRRCSNSSTVPLPMSARRKTSRLMRCSASSTAGLRARLIGRPCRSSR